MPSKRTPKPTGPLLEGIESEIQQQNTEAGRPYLGMPTLSQIESECLRYGLSKDDAEFLHDFWLMNGFKVGKEKVKDFCAAIRFLKARHWFPSQEREHESHKDRARSRNDDRRRDAMQRRSNGQNPV